MRINTKFKLYVVTPALLFVLITIWTRKLFLFEKVGFTIGLLLIGIVGYSLNYENNQDDKTK